MGGREDDVYDYIAVGGILLGSWFYWMRYYYLYDDYRNDDTTTRTENGGGTVLGPKLTTKMRTEKQDTE